MKLYKYCQENHLNCSSFFPIIDISLFDNINLNAVADGKSPYILTFTLKIPLDSVFDFENSIIFTHI